MTSSRLGKPLDPEIVVLKLTTLDGRPLALVWNFAIHGTMLSAGNLRLSGDVMGVASAQLEQKLGAPALFVNGAVGDVSPAHHGEARWSRRPPRWPRRSRSAGGGRGRCPSRACEISERTVSLPSPAVSLERCLGSWVPGFFAVPLGSAMPRAVSLVAAALGDTAWVTIPGELQTVLGQTIKREARARFAAVLVAGVSNGYLGYFMTREDAHGATYVACATLYGPTAGACLADAAIDLLNGLRPESRSATRASSACDAATEAR